MKYHSDYHTLFLTISPKESGWLCFPENVKFLSSNSFLLNSCPSSSPQTGTALSARKLLDDTPTHSPQPHGSTNEVGNRPRPSPSPQDDHEGEWRPFAISPAEGPGGETSASPHDRPGPPHHVSRAGGMGGDPYLSAEGPEGQVGEQHRPYDWDSRGEFESHEEYADGPEGQGEDHPDWHRGSREVGEGPESEASQHPRNRTDGAGMMRGPRLPRLIPQAGWQTVDAAAAVSFAAVPSTLLLDPTARRDLVRALVHTWSRLVGVPPLATNLTACTYDGADCTALQTSTNRRRSAFAQLQPRALLQIRADSATLTAVPSSAVLTVTLTSRLAAPPGEIHGRIAAYAATVTNHTAVVSAFGPAHPLQIANAAYVFAAAVDATSLTFSSPTVITRTSDLTDSGSGSAETTTTGAGSTSASADTTVGSASSVGKSTASGVALSLSLLIGSVTGVLATIA